MVQGNQKQPEDNRDLVDRALKDILTAPLADFVKRRLQQNSSDWRRNLRRSLGDYNFQGNEPKWNDPQVSLRTITCLWNDFYVKGEFEYDKRSIVYELINVRNNCAHNETNKFTFNYTWRAFDNMARLLKAIGETEQAAKIEQQQEKLIRQNYARISEPVKKSIEAGINWWNISRTMLEAQKFDRLTSNSLTAIDGVALERDEVYVPLGLVERKQRKKSSQDEGSPEKGSELYREKLIPIENDKFFEQIRYKTKPIAIIGEPGAGKTTLLQKIADWILKEDTDSVPIWISLSEMGTKSLTDYLLEDWLRNATQKITISSQEKEAFEKLLESGKVWLLLDGVDEMAVDNPLQNITSQLNQGWINNVRVVLTCRLNIWDANKNALYDFDVYRNLNFNSQQVDGFISNWFQNNTQKGKNLRSLLQQPGKERIGDLIKNPLRLMLLCYSWQQQNDLQRGLPSTKAELYEWFAESFYTWNQGKVDEQFSKTELDRALGKLAVRAIDSKESRFRLRETFIGQHLEASLFEVAQNLGWLNQVGVAAENPNEKVYAFYHPSFEEYFASIAIDHWHFFFNPLPVNPIQGTYRIFEPQWKEVILLWLGRNDIPVEQKEELIKTLLEFGDECAELYGDRAYFSVRAYFLAAAATTEFQDCSLKEQIIKRVVQLGFGYFDSNTQTWETFPYHVKTSAEQALKEADNSDVADVLLLAIFDLLDIDTFSNKEKINIFFNLFWCLNEFAPQNPYVIDKITVLIDERFVRKEEIQSDSEYGIYGQPIWITEWLPFSKIKVSNPQIIKAISEFIKIKHQKIIEQRQVPEQKESLPTNPLFINEEQLLLEKALKQNQQENLKPTVFEAAGNTLAKIAVGNQQAVNLLISILKREAQDNFIDDLYLKIIDWLNIISPRNKEAVRFLSELIKTTQNQLLCYKIAKAILKIEAENLVACLVFKSLLLQTNNKTFKLQTALDLIEIRPNYSSIQNNAINTLFHFLQQTNLNNLCSIPYAKYIEIQKIIIALTNIAPQNHNVFERLVGLIKNNCHSCISKLIISELSQINHSSWKLFEVYSDLLEQNLDNLVKLQIALELIKIKPNNNDIYHKIINLFQNRKRQRIYYDAALDIVAINPNELDAIKFLIDWVTPEPDIFIEEDRQIDFDCEAIVEFFIQYNVTIEPLIEILQTYKRDSSLITDLDRRYKFNVFFSLDRRYKFNVLLKLLEEVGNQTNNPNALAVLSDLLQIAKEPQLRYKIARILGKIAPNNSQAISILIEFLNEDREHDISQSEIISDLGEISVGNQAVVDALLELMISKDNELEWEIIKSLQEIIQGKQFVQVVNTLKNCPTSNYSDVLLWHCAQNMSYPKFYRAWHYSQITPHPEVADIVGVGTNSSTLTLNLENLPQQISIAIDRDVELKDNVRLVCININKIIDRDNPAIEIYDQMLDYNCSEKTNGEPETMPSLKSYWHSLQRNSDKMMVLVFYDSTALEPTCTGFNQSFLNALNTFQGAICVITEQPVGNLKQFSPNEPHLVDNFVGWIRKLRLES